MGCQKAIARQIVDGKADYVLGLKGNQEKLHHFVMNYTEKQLDNDSADGVVQRHIVTEKLHGRMESRIYTQMPVPEDMPMLDDRAGLKSIGSVVRCYEKQGKKYCDIRYYQELRSWHEK